MYQLPILHIAITNLRPNLYPPECFIPYKINNPNQWRIKKTSWPVGQKKRSADKFDSSDPSYCQFLIKL